MSECPSKKGGKKKKKKSLGRWQINSRQLFLCVCVCVRLTVRFRVCSCTHTHTHTDARAEKADAAALWAGQFDAHFYDCVAVLLVVARRLKCRLASSPPHPPPTGGLGCRLWLRDPLLLCSPGWSQEGLCRRGQHYGTARRGTPTALRLH